MPEQGTSWLGLGRSQGDTVSAMRTCIDARNGTHDAISLFHNLQALRVMAQLIHPDAMLNFVPARILLVRDSTVSAHSASRSVGSFRGISEARRLGGASVGSESRSGG
jgi:hypothetical protein